MHTRALTVVFLWCAPLAAQQMLADIDPRPPLLSPASDPRGFVALGNLTLFHAKDPEHGRELWRSDGTAAGTFRISEIGAGSADGLAIDTPLFVLGQRVVFLAYDNYVSAVFTSDGTRAGTHAVAPVGAVVTQLPNAMSSDGQSLWFASTSPATGSELWRTDGTLAGTGMVIDLWPGASSGLPSSALDIQIRVIGAQCWFSGDDGSGGFEPFVTDGTPAGTHRVADVVPGATGCNPHVFTPIGNSVVFTALSPAHVSYASLWISDGTVAGTREIVPWPTFAYRPDDLAVVGGRVVFNALLPAYGSEPCASDGTMAGTVVLRDIYPGASTSISQQFTTVGPRVFFTAYEPTHGTELWSTDGTSAGTSLVADLEPGSASSAPYALIAHNAAVWFAASTAAAGTELWTSNGTAAGTVLVADFRAGTGGSAPTALTSVAGSLWLSADDGVHGFEPVSSDGTANGTRLVADLALTEYGSDPGAFVEAGLRGFFQAVTISNGRETFRTDGTPQGTALYRDAAPGPTWSPDPALLADGDRLLWLQSGNLAASDLLGDHRSLLVATSANSSELVAIPGGFVFGSGLLLKFTDGTAAGTRTVYDFNRSLLYPAGPRRVTAFGDRALFLASEGQSSSRAGLWITDGTTAGTVLLVGAPVGVGSSTEIDFVVAGGLFYATVTDLTSLHLFAGDGTSVWSLASQSLPATGTTTTRRLATLGPWAVFSGADAAAGREPWISDGSVAGTRRLVDLAAGTASSDPDQFTSSGGLVYFAADDHAHGRELFVTDGTPAGTRLVADIDPGSEGSSPHELSAPGDAAIVVFSAADLAHGDEVWSSDGTVAGTRRLTDLRPGAEGSHPRGFTRVDDRLLFSADDGFHGREPYAMPLAALGTAAIHAIGSGCAGSQGQRPRASYLSTPRIGDAGFALTLDHARAQTPAGVLVAVTASLVTHPSNCLLLAGDSIALLGAGTDANGNAFAPLPLPLDPALVGFRVFAQWIVADTGGRLLGVLAASDTLSIVIGR
ncbi:MAG: ELWxxDGT repeat protein [Planctomycetota bacterium]